MALRRALAIALALVFLSSEAAGQDAAPGAAAAPRAPASVSFAAAGGEDVTASPPLVTQRLIRALETGDEAGLMAISGLGRIPLEAIEGVDLHPDDRMDVLGWGPQLSEAYMSALASRIRAEEGGASLVRLLQQDDGWVGVFRLGGGVSSGRPLYAEARISPSGQLLDMYPHWRGVMLSESVRLEVFAMLARRDARRLAGLLGVARVSRDDARRWLEVLAANDADGDHAAVATLLDAMDPAVRGTRLWLLERGLVASRRDDAAGVDAMLAQLEARFPDDPGLQMLFAQEAEARGDAADELAHLEAFRRAIAADPLLDAHACRLAGNVARWPEAMVACGHVAVALPDESVGWFGLMQASGHAVATPTFMDAVEGYERQFERWVNVPKLVEDAAMVELAADPVFQAWLEQRLVYERKLGLDEGMERDAPADEGPVVDEAETPRPRRRR